MKKYENSMTAIVKKKMKGAEEEDARRKANLKWKIVGCTGNKGRRKQAAEEERLFF